LAGRVDVAHPSKPRVNELVSQAVQQSCELVDADRDDNPVA
jgi:hypothetical protein